MVRLLGPRALLRLHFERVSFAVSFTVLGLSGDAYLEAGIYRRGEIAVSASLPDFSVAVSAVFDAD
jgi:hypothetical protein